MEALQHLAGGSTRIATDAKDALIWLDDVSDDPAVSEAGLVQLQGGEDEYERWADVEKFLLPETLLSMKPESEASDDVAADMDGLHIDQEDMESASESSRDSNELRTHTPSSPRSAYSASSPAVMHSSPYKGAKTPPMPVNGRVGHMKTYSNGSFKTGESASVVPLNYKRLFNYIVWRINHGQQYSGTLSNDLDTFILLTNDDRKRQIAQRFGIRAKRLEQLRDIVAREDREYKNRQTVLKKEIEAKNEDESDDEEEVLLKRAPKGPKDGVQTQKIWDPNSYGRKQPTLTGPAPAPASAPTPVPVPRTALPPPHTSINSSLRGGRGGRGNMRGGPANGRGNFGPRSVNSNIPRQPQPQKREVYDPSKPIDPDSFSRPVTAASPARGHRRKLWEPN